jgi:hypothetical protein
LKVWRQQQQRRSWHQQQSHQQLELKHRQVGQQQVLQVLQVLPWQLLLLQQS